MVIFVAYEGLMFMANTPRELKVRFNNAKSRFTLKQIHKLGELLDIVGIPDSPEYPRDTPLSFGLIKELQEKYKDGIPSPIVESKNTARPLYHFTLDLPYPHTISPAEENKDSTTTTVKELHEIVAPLLPLYNPAQKAKLLYFQRNAAEEAWLKIKRENLKALMFRVNTGDGKTYAIGQILRWLLDEGYFKNILSPWKILYVTKASVVEQTKRVLRDEFGLDLIDDVFVTNYDSLRASLGEFFLRYEEKVEFGERIGRWVWRAIYPIVVVWDECQALKNEGSEQSKIGQAYNEIQDDRILQFFLSATPMSRVTHGKCFAVATRHLYLNKPLTNTTWEAFAKELISGDPKVYSKTFMHRFVKEFQKYIIGFKSVKRKHKAINRTEIIDFDTPEDASIYINAWDEYLKKKREIEGKDLSNSKFLILVQLNIFRQKAELLRARILARRMYKDMIEGKAVLAACCFKPTIAKTISYLHNDYNIPRSQISIIWGGDAAFTARSAPKYSPDDIKQIYARIMAGELVPKKVTREIVKQIEYAAEGFGDMPKELDLGIQSRAKRQEEIDKFQSGKSLFCFFTFQAGGAGLSLHHNEDYLRQRRTYATPTYNEMEMIQALGRAARITSRSDTDQSILVFRNTIEMDVLGSFKNKKTCLDIVIDYSDKQATQWSNEVGTLIGASSGDGESEDDDDSSEMTEKDFEEIEEQ
jgi:hypothetical protein